MSSQRPPQCPLCGAWRGRLGCLDLRRDWRYLRCPDCRLTWRDPESQPDTATEQAQYELHCNSAQDSGYRSFLARLADPLIEHLPPGAQGLDYGCGPGPALARVLEQAGHRMALYDPFFAPNQAVLEDRYDFITCSETAEHFFHPAAEFERLAALLRPGGLLGLMTGIRDQPARFGRWHYRLDPTHVCFYAPRTLDWLAHRHGWRIGFRRGDVTLFRKDPV